MRFEYNVFESIVGLTRNIFLYYNHEQDKRCNAVKGKSNDFNSF